MSVRASMLMTSLVVLVLGCRGEPQPSEAEPAKSEPAQPAEPAKPTSETQAEAGESESETGEADDPRSGEAAHVIPYADRTSMGYLLLLPDRKQPPTPTREQLATLVRQAFPTERSQGEIDLLLQLIATEPHTTELGGFDLEVPTLDDADAGPKAPPDDEQAAAAERQRIFDLIGLHIEIIRLGVGDDVIPSAALSDPVLTRALEPSEREGLPGRQWALLLRADYRNQHGVRGLRLLQTLVRVVAEHEQALIHDPDTLETMNLAAFEARRLRVTAGNVGDQLAIVPFEDRLHVDKLRLSTRGMRRFGAVDLELDGLPPDPAVLQQASDFLAALAFALVREGEVDVSGFAVVVPDELEVDGVALDQTFGAGKIARCAGCPGRVSVHLVERAAEDHDPEDHVVARVVAPQPESDAPDYDHPQWALSALARLFGTASPPSGP
jgi:hypothetical protein